MASTGLWVYVTEMVCLLWPRVLVLLCTDFFGEVPVCFVSVQAEGSNEDDQATFGDHYLSEDWSYSCAEEKERTF